MADRVKSHPKIDILWNKIPKELVGDKSTGLKGIMLEDTVTRETKEYSCGAVFYGIGHSPNTDLFKGQLEMDENGYLITKADSTKTVIAGVFAAGDVQDHVFRQAVTAAGSGCMAAIEAERFLG